VRVQRTFFHMSSTGLVEYSIRLLFSLVLRSLPVKKNKLLFLLLHAHFYIFEVVRKKVFRKFLICIWKMCWSLLWCMYTYELSLSLSLLAAYQQSITFSSTTTVMVKPRLICLNIIFWCLKLILRAVLMLLLNNQHSLLQQELIFPWW
jgi:hypothetical protein